MSEGIAETMADIPTRTCRVCSQEKPRTPEYWYRDRQSPDGLEYQCKPCRLAAKRAKYSSEARQAKARANTTSKPRDPTKFKRREGRKALRSLVRLAARAALLQGQIDNAHQRAIGFASDITDLVALAIEHGHRGLTLSDIVLLPEAFEVAIRFAEDHPEPIVPVYGSTWGCDLVRYHLPPPSKAALELAERFGSVPAIIDPADVDLGRATMAHSRCVSIASRALRLRVASPVSTLYGWCAPAAHREALERLHRMLPPKPVWIEAPNWEELFGENVGREYFELDLAA